MAKTETIEAKMIRTHTLGSGEFGPTTRYLEGRAYQVEPGIAEKLRRSGAAEIAHARPAASSAKSPKAEG